MQSTGENYYKHIFITKAHNQLSTDPTKSKGKAFPVHTTEAYGGRAGIALPILDLSTRQQ